MMRVSQKFQIYILLSFVFALLDQVTKELARIYFTPETNIEVIPGFLKLILIENRGISFGAFSELGETTRLIFLVGVPILVVIFLIFYNFFYINKLNRLESIGYALITGGACGNLYDRIVYESVTDFKYFLFFDRGLFVNNAADDFISIGLVMIIFGGFLQSRKKKI